MPSAAIPDVTASRADAYWWLVGRLQADAMLQQFVQNWYVHDGDSDPDQPLPADAVSVRLTPTYENPGEVAVRGHGRRFIQMPVLVKIETRVPGQHGDSSINLCELIQQAAVPQTRAERDAMKAMGVSWVEDVQSPAMVGTHPQAAGSIRLMVAVVR